MKKSDNPAEMPVTDMHKRHEENVVENEREAELEALRSLQPMAQKNILYPGDDGYSDLMRRFAKEKTKRGIQWRGGFWEIVQDNDIYKLVMTHAAAGLDTAYGQTSLQG